MTPLYVIIVDDEPLARDLMRVLLAEIDGVDVVGVFDSGPDAVRAIINSPPDAVFLDVEMPGFSGFDVVTQLIAQMGRDALPQIVFATAYDEYAVQAFRVNAVDYLLKPIDDAALLETVERLREAKAKGQQSAQSENVSRAVKTAPLKIKDGERLLVIAPHDLIWLKADGDYVRLQLTRRDVLIRSTLKRVEQLLPEPIFQRAHRSSIVNVAHISALAPASKGGATAQMSSGHSLSVSRSFYKILKSRMDE